MNVVDAVGFFFGQQGYLILYSEVGAASYNLFENRTGEWYIMKSVIASAVTTYTYAKGSSAAATAWAARTAQSYGIASVTFA